MPKRTNDLAEVAQFKDRFRRLSVAELQKKQAIGSLQKAASAAIRELLKEKHQVQAPDPEAWENLIAEQRKLCRRVGAEYLAAAPELKLGIALTTLAVQPLNALRHLPIGDTSGWFVWGGEELSSDPQFFRALHIAHLGEHAPKLLHYLGLAPGWRVLLAPGNNDTWFDSSLLVQ